MCVGGLIPGPPNSLSINITYLTPSCTLQQKPGFTGGRKQALVLFILRNTVKKGFLPKRVKREHSDSYYIISQEPKVFPNKDKHQDHFVISTNRMLLHLLLFQ